MEILWYFVIYSIMGWIAEVMYQAVHRGEIINRGFLNGPVCPIYGFGAIFIFTAYNLIEGMIGGNINIYIDFAIGVFLATMLELFAGWALYHLFHARWWDYSDRRFQFHGYICLEFSLIWGFAATFVRELVQQGIERMVSHFPKGILGVILLCLIYSIYVADTVITVITVNNLNKRLHEIDVLSKQLSDMEDMGRQLRKLSDSMSEQIGSNTLKNAQKIGEGQVQAALAKAELRDSIEEKRLEAEQMLNESRQKVDESIAESRKKYEESRRQFDENIENSKKMISEAIVEGKQQFDENVEYSKRMLSDAIEEGKQQFDGNLEERRREYLERKEEAGKRMEELKNRIMSRKWFGSYRLLKAFPGMKHDRYSEVLEEIVDKLK